MQHSGRCGGPLTRQSPRSLDGKQTPTGLGMSLQERWNSSRLGSGQESRSQGQWEAQ